MEAIGAVDELNAHLGLCATTGEKDALAAQLITLCAKLFELGADLADTESSTPGAKRLLPAGAEQELEVWIDGWEAVLPPLRHFILPGGSERSARLQVARAVCRRAERSLVTIWEAGDALPPGALAFVNRLGDLLFVMARVANQAAGVGEVEWRGK